MSNHILSPLRAVARMISLTVRLALCLIIAFPMTALLLIAYPFGRSDSVFSLWDRMLKALLVWRSDYTHTEWTVGS